MTDLPPADENLDLIFLIDRSGSMYGSEDDTIGGFNSFIEKEKAKEENTTVTTILFDHDLDRQINNKVLFVIMTDGMENSSVEFSKSQIRNMIENHKWEFIFIGADIDSYSEASRIGIRGTHTANYKKSRRGLEDAYTSVERASYCLRNNVSLDDANWKEDLEKYD